jgi:hypothetical protein
MSLVPRPSGVALQFICLISEVSSTVFPWRDKAWRGCYSVIRRIRFVEICCNSVKQFARPYNFVKFAMGRLAVEP